jgi:hypothetical protein
MDTSIQTERKATKPSIWKYSGIGAVAGFLTILVSSIIFPIVYYIIDGDEEINIVSMIKDWTINIGITLMAGIPGALLLGLPAGGIVGLILGSIFKNKKAAAFGGIVTGLILIPVIIYLFIKMIVG